MVKTDSLDDTEYVTSFYKRVQHKVKDRDGLFSKEYQEEDLISTTQSQQPAEVKPKRRPFLFLQKAHSQDAAVVRGGAASSLKMQSPPLNKHSHGDRSGHKSKRKNSIGSSGSSYKQRETVEDRQEEREADDLYFSEFDEYSESNDYYSQTTEDDDQDDYPPGEHHLGLLRVPCSIAINSSEDGRIDHYSGGRGGAFDDYYGMWIDILSNFVLLSLIFNLSCPILHCSEENTHCSLRRHRSSSHCNLSLSCKTCWYPPSHGSSVCRTCYGSGPL